MENDHVFVFLILTMVLSLGTEAILFFTGGGGYTGLSLAVGAFLSVYVVKSSETYPRWRW